MKQTNKDLLHQKTKRSMRRKGNLRQVLFIFTLLAFFASSFLPAFASITLGSLTGKVLNKTTGKPVANAFVVAKGLGQTFTSTTDTTGYFSFVDMEPGTYSLKISRVGYQTVTVTDIPVTANSTVYESYKLMPAVYKVKGITVSGYQSQTVNPRETMTYYQFTKHELTQFLPAVASLGTEGLLTYFPGVVNYTATSSFALAGPHVRGGSGFGTVYALDGIPLNNTTFFNDLGTVGLTTGLSDYQFYPGIYPVQYGNGADGYQNTIVPEGFGKLHGSLQFSYGFWLDPGENAPIINDTTGQIVGASNLRPPNPDILNLQLSGQAVHNKLHYYLNYVSDVGGNSGLNPSLPANDIQALTYEGQGGTTYLHVYKDGVLNLNYDLDLNNELQFLYFSGFDQSAFETGCAGGPGGCSTPPLPATESSFTVAAPYLRQHYDLESLGYTHHFSPGKAMTFRMWQFNDEPDQFSPSVLDGYYTQDNISRTTAARLDFHLQLNPQNTVVVGGQYAYDANNVHAYYTGEGGPFLAFLASTLGESTQANANTQNSSLWLNDEWTPTPKWDINVGLRWDQMVYQPLCGTGILTQANCQPFAALTYTGFSPDQTINNPLDTTGLFTHCTPFGGVCVDNNLRPSFVQPRISASYRVTHTFTVKAGWGEFATFAPAGNVDFTSQLCSSGTGASTFSPCLPGTEKSVALTTAGNVAQSGNDYDLSFEYMLNRNSYVKVTPYYKTVQNPLIFSYVPLAATGGTSNATSLTSKGIEVVLHTRNWHGVTGTLNYTHNQSTIIGDPEYTVFLAPNFALSNSISGGAISQANALATAPTLYNQVNSSAINADWDVPNTMNLLLNYTTPNKKWEFAPTITWANGQPYGFGAANLQGLYTNLVAACAAGPTVADPFISPATCAEDVPASGNYNPLNEKLPNSLMSPNVLTGDLAITYNQSKNFDVTFQIFNLWNGDTLLGRNSSATIGTFMAALGYPYSPDFSPLLGNYGPAAFQTIRQYYLTTTFHF
jgi:hypothetical protein